jgi:hypothetical protein
MVTLRPRLFSALQGRPVSIGLASLLRFRLAALLPIEDLSPLMIVLAATAHRALFHFPTWSSLAVTFLVPGAVQMAR